MTQECEKILNAAEKIQQEKARHKLSYHSQEDDPIDIMREYEDNLAQYHDDLLQILEEHKQNSMKWSQWQLDQSALIDGKDLIESVAKQLEQAKKVNANVTKMLTDISNHVTNFRALDNVVKKPQVAVDYRDLDYESKLDFVDDVELSLKNTKEILDRCKSLTENLESEYNSITDKEQAGAEISSINKQLREGDDL